MQVVKRDEETKNEIESCYVFTETENALTSGMCLARFKPSTYDDFGLGIKLFVRFLLWTGAAFLAVGVLYLPTFDVYSGLNIRNNVAHLAAKQRNKRLAGRLTRAASTVFHCDNMSCTACYLL